MRVTIPNLGADELERIADELERASRVRIPRAPRHVNDDETRRRAPRRRHHDAKEAQAA